MVFFTHVIVMRQRNRTVTASFMKEIAVHVYNSKGVVRKLSNEGVIRPFRQFRDTQNALHSYARYIQFQFDANEEANAQLAAKLKDHADVLANDWYVAERVDGVSKSDGFFPLDAFTRMDEELRWSPQVSADAYDQLDANWKELSRTRWSEFLRS